MTCHRHRSFSIIGLQRFLTFATLILLFKRYHTHVSSGILASLAAQAIVSSIRLCLNVHYPDWINFGQADNIYFRLPYLLQKWPCGLSWKLHFLRSVLEFANVPHSNATNQTTSSSPFRYHPDSDADHALLVVLHDPDTSHILTASVAFRIDSAVPVYWPPTRTALF